MTETDLQDLWLRLQGLRADLLEQLAALPLEVNTSICRERLQLCEVEARLHHLKNAREVRGLLAKLESIGVTP
jgi:hypothetical protein